MPATRENSSTAAAPAANTNANTGGPSIQLPPLHSRDDRGERERDPRADIKDDRERRKDDREAWGGRGLGGGAPSSLSLAAPSRADRSRKRLSIGSIITPAE